MKSLSRNAPYQHQAHKGAVPLSKPPLGETDKNGFALVHDLAKVEDALGLGNDLPDRALERNRPIFFKVEGAQGGSRPKRSRLYQGEAEEAGRSAKPGRGDHWGENGKGSATHRLLPLNGGDPHSLHAQKPKSESDTRS